MRETGDPQVFAVVAAAGSGTRLGFATPKAFVELAGRTLLERSLDQLAASGRVDVAYVMVSAEMCAAAQRLVELPRNRQAWAGMRVWVAVGGGERSDSVFAGLRQIHAQLEEMGESAAGAVVAVHDAARCLVPAELVRRVIDEALVQVRSGVAAGVVPAVPVADTIKQVRSTPGATLIVDTPPRGSLRAAQTPQVFDFGILFDANLQHQAAAGAGDAAEITDDASLLEHCGFPVAVVPGDPRAMKITTAQDFQLAQLLAGAAREEL